MGDITDMQAEVAWEEFEQENIIGKTTQIPVQQDLMQQVEDEYWKAAYEQQRDQEIVMLRSLCEHYNCSIEQLLDVLAEAQRFLEDNDSPEAKELYARINFWFQEPDV